MAASRTAEGHSRTVALDVFFPPSRCCVFGGSPSPTSGPVDGACQPMPTVSQQEPETCGANGQFHVFVTSRRPF